MKVKIFLQDGKEDGVVDLNEKIFSVKENIDLMQRSVVMRLANARENIAHTKGRSEKRGGGKKPWRQKGTGRARAGSSRSPLWKGGAVSHGPKNNRNFKKRMTKKEKVFAIFSALSSKFKTKENDTENIYVLKKFENEEPKTKDFAKMMDNLPQSRQTLYITPRKDEVLEKSAKNIQNTKTLRVQYLNVYDILNSKKICFVEDALGELEKIFLKGE